MTQLDLRVTTLNISGGQKAYEDSPNGTRQSRLQALNLLVKEIDPDVLCLQEVSQFVDADGVTHNLLDEIKQTSGYPSAYFGKTVSMETHLQVKKDVMVQGIFNDWQNWSKGNAILSKLPFCRLGNPEIPGKPRNIPLYQPPVYKGNRDTEPRFAILARLQQPPFPFIATLHLTTLMGERHPPLTRNKIEQSHLLRDQQVRQLLELVRRHILETDQPFILTGDFNAPRQEFCIAHLLESENQFVRLKPEEEGSSHVGIPEAIDHIFFYPRKRLVDYRCWIEASNLSRLASDHLPVVAEIQLK